MKISEMLKREDFYSISEKTLHDYYGQQDKRTILYVYPKINAITTCKPSKDVKKYLLNEFALRSIVKRILAKSYVRMCLSSSGLLSDRKIVIDAEISDATLIYPCNKKYRIFDFVNKYVGVMAKARFDTHDLVHEIEFRRRTDNPPFVPKIIDSNDCGYRESIIDGSPLARISDHKEFLTLKEEAYQELRKYYQKYDSIVDAKEYILELQNRISLLMGVKSNNVHFLNDLVQILSVFACEFEKITIGFSHGDLQAGNIWVTNGERKIYIIDWESWGTRSVWYDYDTLFNDLRPGGISCYLNKDIAKNQKAVVLLEDIIFQLNELNSLPLNYGNAKFLNYIQRIHDWLD